MKATGETEEGDRPSAPYAARPDHGIGTWRWITIGAAATLAGGIATLTTTPCGRFHFAVELAGSDRRLREWLEGCGTDLRSARTSIAADLLLVVGATVLLAAILRRWWPLYHAPRLKHLERAIVIVPVLGGTLAALADLLTLARLHVSDGRFVISRTMVLPIVLATLGWTTWLLAVVAAAAGVTTVMLAVARRCEHDVPQISPAADPAGAGRTDGLADGSSRGAHAPSGDIGICCSGGGIRAAAFSLGALERLEQGGVLDRARWLTAVSGGAYAATSWRLVKADDPDRPAAAEIIDWLSEPIPGSAGGRHRFLRNGPGGLGRPILAALIYIAFNVVVLAAFVLVLAWPTGWLLGSRAVQPDLRAGGGLPDRLGVAAELWLPGLLVLAAAFAVLLVSALPSWKVAPLWKAAFGLAILAVVLEVLLVGTPLAMVVVGRWLTGGTASVRAVAVGGSALAGVLAAVWRIASRPVVSRLTARLPELGGVFLALAALIWAGKVATDSATAGGLFRSVWVWLTVVVAFGLVYVEVDTTELSIHRIYRKRLRRTFGLAYNARHRLHSPAPQHQLTWDQMPAAQPELVICCAQQRTGIAPGGLPAETFTISRSEIRIGDTVVPTADYLARLPARLATERFVSSWIATSGAAFASAMGRLSKGSTNALLAALNIDLGIWIPNPRLVHDPNAVFDNKVRLGYLFKEILGWYDPADRYVFVADGGHWENLGLVELLRRRCAVILCVDASGDAVGAFTTLREAVELAGLELPGIVESVDLATLKSITGADGVLPTGIVASLLVTYTDPGHGGTSTGMIHYAKAQMASGLDIALRRYSKADPRFPNYSTGDQFLSNEQFHELLALGREAGDRLVQIVNGAAPPPGSPPA